MKLLDLDMT